MTTGNASVNATLFEKCKAFVNITIYTPHLILFNFVMITLFFAVFLSFSFLYKDSIDAALSLCRGLHQQMSNFNRNSDVFCFFCWAICSFSGGSDRISSN